MKEIEKLRDELLGRSFDLYEKIQDAKVRLHQMENEYHRVKMQEDVLGKVLRGKEAACESAEDR